MIYAFLASPFSKVCFLLELDQRSLDELTIVSVQFFGTHWTHTKQEVSLQTENLLPLSFQRSTGQFGGSTCAQERTVVSRKGLTQTSIVIDALFCLSLS